MAVAGEATQSQGCGDAVVCRPLNFAAKPSHEMEKPLVRKTAHTVFSNSRVASSPVSVQHLFRRVASSIEVQAEGSAGFDEGSLACGGFKGGGGSGKAEQ